MSTFGKVVARFMRAVADGSGGEPVQVPSAGEVWFTSFEWPDRRVLSAGSALINEQTVKCPLAEEGNPAGILAGTMLNSDGQEGARLAYGWWLVEFKLKGAHIESFKFEVKPEHTESDPLVLTEIIPPSPEYIFLESILGLPGAPEWALVSDAEVVSESFIFGDNGLLTRVDLPNAGERLMSSVFANASALRSVSLPKVMYGGQWCFAACTALEYVDLPSLRTVETYAFQDCTSLKVVSLPELVSTGLGLFAKSGVVDVSLPKLARLENSTFADCGALKKISVPSVKGEVGTAAFDDCTSLERVDLPAGITGLGTRCFFNAKALKTLILRNSAQVVAMTAGANGPFSGSGVASGTGFVYVPDALVSAYKADADWSTYKDQIKPLSQAPAS